VQWASDRNNLMQTSPHWIEYAPLRDALAKLGLASPPPDWSDVVPDGNQIVMRWVDGYGTGVINQVIPTFKAMLATQLKGLMLLTGGWGNTPFASNLAIDLEHITATIAAMNRWWNSVSPDGAVARALRESGPRPSQNEMAGPWLQERENIEAPAFDENWVFWFAGIDVSGSNNVAFVFSPWNYGSCRAALGVDNFGRVNNVAMRGGPGKFGKDYYYTFNRMDAVTVGRPVKPASPPDALTKFLSGLPTTVDQLQELRA
jgi:hypothetical protein